MIYNEENRGKEAFAVRSPRIAAAAAFLICFILLLGGCADPPEPLPVGAETTAAAAEPVPTETGPGETAAPTEPLPTEPTVNEADYNRLTGEYDNPAGADSRAVGVMIGNNSKSRPQIGVWSADLFLEAETEGGITRIMAVFADASRAPDVLCPVRSARTPFVLMAQSLDLVYVHAGGSPNGLAAVKDLNIPSVNALSDNVTFWRDAKLKAARGTEYSLCTSGTKIAARMQKQGWRSTSDRAPFAFGEAEGGGPCAELQVTFSGSQTNSFLYDSQAGLYTKYLGKLAKPTLHADSAGNGLQVANVLILYDSKYAENEVTISFELKSGEGLLASGGRVRPVRWTRTAKGLSVTENGSAALFLPGKTYICLVTAANKNATVTR